MADENYVASRHIVWQMIPENRAGHVPQSRPGAAQLEAEFPRLRPSRDRGVVELAPNKTKIITEVPEYVFAFDERTTLVAEAAEFVRTGILELHYNNVLVLRLNISPPNSDELGKSWVPRGIEEFQDGEWVAKLTQLVPQLVSHETEQEKKEAALRQNELKNVAELKEKLTKLSPVTTEKPSWFQRLWGRSGSEI